LCPHERIRAVSGAISGFNDGNIVGDDYTYDANGNMTVDKNKNITAIVYNHLNLPTKITFQRDEFSPTISYLYNANGVKLQKIINTEDFYPTVTTTDYLGGFQYNMNVSYSLKKGKYIAITTPVALQFFPTAEGYVKNTVVSAVNNYSYVFNYTDHLGNVRLSYQDTNKDGLVANSEILEESNYYPFGMKHSGYNSGNLQANYKYKYNGKELQDELGLNVYDMDMRQYDPAIGRWVVQDPIVHLDVSPYSAFNNNPIYFADPSGASPIYNSTTGQYVINGNVVTFDEAVAYANSGGNSDGSNNNNVSGNEKSSTDDINPKDAFGYQSQYPRTVQVMKQLRNYVKSNPSILKALAEYSGYSTMEVLSQLEYFQGDMTLTIEDLSWDSRRPEGITVSSSDIRLSILNSEHLETLKTNKEIGIGV